ncbi:unnamed protein product, partial [Vitis vinifera]
MTRFSSANRFRFQFSISKYAFWWCLFFIVLLCFVSNHLLLSDNDRRLLRNRGKGWEQRVLSSASPRSSTGSTVLVTGAAGFIGSHVSAALRNRGDGVVGLDNFNNYYDVSLKHDRRAMLESSGSAKRLNHSQPLSGHPLARYMDSILRFPSPKPIEQTSLQVSMLQQRRLVKRLHIAIITSTVYRSPGCGVVARDFTYIDDIVKGCLAALDTAEKSTGSGGKKMRPAQLRVYNLGNTSPVEVGSLVSILERLLKVKARRVATPMPRNGDVMYTHANISLAEKELGYKPTTDLRSGLEKFVKWYLTYYNQSTVN